MWIHIVRLCRLDGRGRGGGNAQVPGPDHRGRETRAGQSICSELPIPVLFITGSPAEVRMRMPSHALIQKPFSTDDVTAGIRLVLERPDQGRS